MQAACEAVKFVLETWSKPNIDQRLEDDSQVATGLLENLDYCTTAYLLLLDVMMFTFSPMAAPWQCLITFKENNQALGTARVVQLLHTQLQFGEYSKTLVRLWQQFLWTFVVPLLGGVLAQL